MPFNLLTSRDGEEIRRTSSVLSSPLDYPDADAWRRATLDCVSRLTGLAGVQFGIAPLEGVDKFVVDGFQPTALRDYMTYWHHQDEVFKLYPKMGSGAFTRERYSRIDDFGERRAKTAIWNEFYIPNSFVGAAGAVLVGPSLFAQLAVHTKRYDDPRVGERAYQQFAAIFPAMEAGVRTLQVLNRVRNSLGNVLDQLATPIALFDQRARAVHYNRALRALLSADPARTRTIESAVMAVAGSAVSARQHGGGMLEPPAPVLAAHLTRVTWVQSALNLSQSLLMIIFEPVRPQVITRASAMRLGLSTRQAEAALCVSKGMRTDEVACAMKIRPTTAAHHIEAAMRKLGVSSRAALGAVLRGDRPMSSPTR